MTSQKIEQLDPNFGSPRAEKGLKYYDAKDFVVKGKGWEKTERFFDRLPAKAKGVVPNPVWELSHHSAGICIKFSTNSNIIEAEWILYSEHLAMPHMPATGVSGLDLYFRDANNKWRWCGAGRPSQAGKDQKQVLLNKVSAEKTTQEYMLYLPLYNGVEKIVIGVEDNAIIERKSMAYKDKPICFYGTSITQGACASRPGMAYPAIIGRMFDISIINLGFSGNAKAEKEMAELLAELDVSLFVIDCLPNMDEQLVGERLEIFLDILSRSLQNIPILVVANIQYQDAFICENKRKMWLNKNQKMIKIVKKMQRERPNLFLFDKAIRLLGNDGDATVDGIHPNDLGFSRIAKALASTIRGILSAK